MKRSNFLRIAARGPTDITRRRAIVVARNCPFKHTPQSSHMGVNDHPKLLNYWPQCSESLYRRGDKCRGTMVLMRNVVTEIAKVQIRCSKMKLAQVFQLPLKKLAGDKPPAVVDRGLTERRGYDACISAVVTS